MEASVIEATKTNDHGRRDATVKLPAPDCDLLTGIRQIAAWYGLDCGQVRQRISDGLIPTFRVKRKNTVYALKSLCNAHARIIAEKKSGY